MTAGDTTVLHSHGPHVILGCADAIVTDGTIVALGLDPTYAHRIAELLTRHGLVDVPDDASALKTTEYCRSCGQVNGHWAGCANASTPSGVDQE